MTVDGGNMKRREAIAFFFKLIMAGAAFKIISTTLGRGLNNVIIKGKGD